MHQRPAEVSVQVIRYVLVSARVSGNYQVWKKSQQKGTAGQVPVAHTGRGSICVPTVQMEGLPCKQVIAQGWQRVLHGSEVQ